MLELGRGPDLGEEPLGPDDGGQLGFEHLQGYLPLVSDVVGQVYGILPIPTVH